MGLKLILRSSHANEAESERRFKICYEEEKPILKLTCCSWTEIRSHQIRKEYFVLLMRDLVLMAKEETVLQGMIDKLTEVGRWYGMEINVEKTKVMRISRQPSPVTIMIEQKQLEIVECFKYLGSILTNDGRCTCEIKSRISMAKAAFNKKKTLFTSKLDLVCERN